MQGVVAERRGHQEEAGTLADDVTRRVDLKNGVLMQPRADAGSSPANIGDFSLIVPCTSPGSTCNFSDCR